MRNGASVLTANIILIVLGLAVAIWSNVRGAAEIATYHGRRACEESGVQWLDHTVMLEGLSLKRAANGWLRTRRRYRFEFSTDGHDRHRGHLELLGQDLQWLRMPPEAKPRPSEPLVPPPWEVRMSLTPPRPSDVNGPT